MRLILAALAFVILAAAPVRADAVKNRLFAHLAAAQTEAEGRKLENEVWTYWLDQAPDKAVRAAIDKGMERREAYDFRAAEEQFDIAVEQAPDYAEGWNQRAFIRFLRDNNEGALSDLEKTIALEPRHFGAWSGLYHVLLRMGRTRAAYGALAHAVDIHPWLKERDQLPKEWRARQPKSKDL
ncbi:hypothetical protein CSC94_16045 [Zhengella mangrovi]|uniref:Uncharacterized protein n=1 Tax=Zhengella mangrovi TaxID=1982044 RepID=A0A2G1QLL8_9HYPH|nr:hypothetical protein [Zhengella mangrovi]PHP66108.1 hypothetical protein CSC94_16045 [Zhengella mangrovi]